MITVLAATGNLSGVILGISSTILTAIILVALKWGWVQLKDMLNEGRAASQSQMDRIEAQTTKTNGTVAEHEKRLNDIDTAIKVERARTELLTDLYLSRKEVAP